MIEEQPITYTMIYDQWAWMQEQETLRHQADIRRRYAMCALQGLIASGKASVENPHLAKACFTVADAMIAAEGGK